jgi:hypothetical protein
MDIIKVYESRAMREMADIHALLERFKAEINWNIVEEHFALFDKHALLKELKEKYG